MTEEPRERPIENAGASESGRARPVVARCEGAPEGGVEPLFPISRVVYRDAEAARAAREEAEKLLAEAERARADAEAERDRLRADLQAERERILAEAEEQGRAAAREEAAGLLLALRHEIGRQRQEYARDVRDAAFRVARAVLQGELVARPEILVQWIERALADAGPRPSLTVLLHPDDHERLRGVEEELRARVAGAESIRVRPSKNVAPREVRVENEQRAAWTVSIDSVLEELRQRVERAAAERAAAERAAHLPSEPSEEPSP